MLLKALCLRIWLEFQSAPLLRQNKEQDKWGPYFEVPLNSSYVQKTPSGGYHSSLLEMHCNELY